MPEDGTEQSTSLDAFGVEISDQPEETRIWTPDEDEGDGWELVEPERVLNENDVPYPRCPDCETSLGSIETSFVDYGRDDGLLFAATVCEECRLLFRSPMAAAEDEREYLVEPFTGTIKLYSPSHVRNGEYPRFPLQRLDLDGELPGGER